MRIENRNHKSGSSKKQGSYYFLFPISYFLHHLRSLLPKNKWLRACIVALLLLVTMAFGISRWYAWDTRNQPLVYGVSFIPSYATSLGVDPQQTMEALLGIGVKQFRLVSYWNETEPAAGKYDFTQLDWQFKKAEAAHAKIILTVGLRQPRWPECHVPSWVDTTKPLDTWQPQLEQFMQTVIERYKNSPSLNKYQLENEYFLKGFGTCTDFSRSRLVSEYNLVKRLDPSHDIIVGRSNNALGFPAGQPTPDQFSISVYKRVWDAGVTHRYLEYPFPAWFYGYIAGVQKIYLGKDMSIAELQAEAWPPKEQTIPKSSLSEQNKSLDAERLKGRFAYGKATGMKSIDLWGAEYWYYRKQVLHDDSLWQVASQKLKQGH
jgi:hypothetical protein